MQRKWTRADILRHVLRPRILIYTVILFAITAAAAWSIAIRLPLKVDVIRDRATMAREVEGERIENVYTLRLMNTEEQPHRYRLSVSGLDGLALAGDSEVSVPAASMKSVSVSLRVGNQAAGKGSHPVHFDIADLDNAQVRLREKAVFIMP